LLLGLEETIAGDGTVKAFFWGFIFLSWESPISWFGDPILAVGMITFAIVILLGVMLLIRTK